MSIRKPLEKKQQNTTNNIDADLLISKGAKVREDINNEEKKWTNLNIRIPITLLKQVDESVNKRVSMPRVAWILEAIQEKLVNENSNKGLDKAL